MDTITLSSKGQLVIPKALRDSARLVAGDMLAVSWVEGELRLRPLVRAPASTLSQVAGCLAKPGRKALTDAQAKAAIQARLKARLATA